MDKLNHMQTLNTDKTQFRWFGNRINRVYLGWKQNKHGLYGLETDETEFE